MTIKQESCEHCRNNPEGKRPFIRMTNLKIDSRTCKKVEGSGKNPSCFFCETINEFVDALKD